MRGSRLIRNACLLTALSVVSSLFGVARAAPPAGPRIDPELRRQLDAADPDDRLLVLAHASDVRSAVRAVRGADLALIERFERIGVAVAGGTPGRISRLARSPELTFLEADRPLSFHLDTSHAATRGREVSNGFSVDGRTVKGDGNGVSIAVIDSGVDGTHPMFQSGGNSKVVKNLKLACHGLFCPDENGVPEAQEQFWVDMTDSGNDTDTGSAGGHGTHVASIAAGVPVTTADGRKLHGAAPAAKIVSLSVGASLSVYGAASALNWVLEHHAAPCGEDVAPSVCPPIKVVNNSYGPTGGGEYDPESANTILSETLASEEGVTVVWSAGNSGGDGSANVTNPSGQSPVPGVISVANYDNVNSATRDGWLDASSSRGEDGEPKTYPDLAAPGTDISGACRPQLTLCSTGFDRRDPDYNTISGTSMAAPHVAGIVAQLVQLDRQFEPLKRLKPADIESLLENTAHKFVGGGAYEADPRNSDDLTSFDKGHGLVDAADAAAAALSTVRRPAHEVCGPKSRVVIDPAGDATLNATQTPLPSEPSLDVTGAKLAADENVFTYTIKVTELSATDPPATNGIAFDTTVVWGRRALTIRAQRLLSTVESFFIENAAGDSVDIQGSFDVAKSVVRFKIPEKALVQLGVKDPFKDGTVLAEFGITAWKIQGVLLAGADTAGQVCPFTIGVGAVPPTSVPVKPLPPPPKPDATISPAKPEHSWMGDVTTNLYSEPLLGEEIFACEAPSGTGCDVTHLRVKVPSGGGTLTISVEADIPVNDYDVYLYGPSGKEIASSANLGTQSIIVPDGVDPEGGFAEVVSVPVKTSGVYTIEIVAFATLESTYSGRAQLS